MVDVESVGGSLFAEVDHFLLYVFGQFDLVAFDGEVVGVEMKRVELLAGRHFLLRVGRYQLVYLLCLLYTSPSPRDLSTSRMPSSA